MESEGSLPFSQESDTCPYPEATWESKSSYLICFRSI